MEDDIMRSFQYIVATLFLGMNAAHAELQLRPFEFDAQSLHRLVSLGVHWFVTDEPKRFSDALCAKEK